LSGGLNHYRFTSLWKVPGSLHQIFDVISRLETYPSWWPEVKEINPIDGTSADARISALLPYSLRFSMSQEVADREAGILRARLAGDLDGYSSWTLKDTPDGCSLQFDQEVVVNKVCLRILAPVARPVFRLNHAVMMYRGERGLRRYLNESPS
jgi:hypothetical protein